MTQSPNDVNNDYFEDHLVIHHPDGQPNEVLFSEEEGKVLRIGRELDNDIILTDLRASRHHAEARRMTGALEIKDLNSANGILVNKTKIESDTWVKVTPGQTIQLAETRIVWQKAAASQSTVAMARTQRKKTDVSATPVAAVAATAPPPQQQKTNMLPWVIGGAVAVLFLILVGILFLFVFSDSGDSTVAEQPPAPVTVVVAPTLTSPSESTGRGEEGSLNSQSLSGEPTATPTPTGPQLAIPVIEVDKVQVSPIIFGASPSTNSAYLFITVRTRNTGNIPFQFSISNFSLHNRNGLIIEEAGATTSENYLQTLGAKNRFENLALTPGGSVFGSLVFELEIDAHNLDLVFNAPDLPPVSMGLGTINMGNELAIAAGTPVAALEPDTGSEQVDTSVPTIEPTPTATRPPLIPAPQEVARSALVGTIAYPVFNGTDYDIYTGQVDGSGSLFVRAHASQPAYNSDGSRLAFHSWDNNSRGLMTMNIDGSNPVIIASFIEDQLPTWSVDSSEVIFLTRRTGDRKSNLRKVSSTDERTEGTILGEGEYPTIGANDQLVFKGWGNTAFGLRTSTANMDEVQTITNVDEDTAPALSPDGQKVAFMSRREGNWNIYVANIDGSELQQLTEDAAQDGLPTWSPDGNAIAFVSDRGGIWAIWAMTPTGKGQSQLFAMEGSPDGAVGSDTFASRGWAEERISWIK